MAYVFLMRFLGVVQAIQEHPQYKQKRTEFDKIISVKNMTEAMDKAEKLADRLSQRYGCTCTYVFTYVRICVCKSIGQYTNTCSYNIRWIPIRYVHTVMTVYYICLCVPAYTYLFCMYVCVCAYQPLPLNAILHSYVDTLQGMSPKMIFLSRWTRRNQLLKNRIPISLINRLLMLWSYTICCRSSQKKYAAHFCCPSLLYIVIYHCVLCPGVCLGLPSQVRMGFLSR